MKVNNKDRIRRLKLTCTIGNRHFHNGFEYIDLGLPSGTKWAKYNVGATSDTEYGNFYQYSKGADQYAATNEQSDYEHTENPLLDSVDTARQTWGGNWHTPTMAQFEELIAKTTYEWITVNGVNGGKFTASNGNYIFIPAAGDWYNGSHNDEGSIGCVWSSSPYGSLSAFYLFFLSGDKYVYRNIRECGFSVRPVID